jgi:hypothetical protein
MGRRSALDERPISLLHVVDRFLHSTNITNDAAHICYCRNLESINENYQIST